MKGKGWLGRGEAVGGGGGGGGGVPAVGKGGWVVVVVAVERGVMRCRGEGNLVSFAITSSSTCILDAIDAPPSPFPPRPPYKPRPHLYN